MAKKEDRTTMSTRALIADASSRLQASQATKNPVVRDIELRRAARDVKRAEVMADLGVELPASFVDAIIRQREHGPSPTPTIIAVCPTISREQFILTLPENHPARLALNKENQ
jgi:hypothetical protein